MYMSENVSKSMHWVRTAAKSVDWSVCHYVKINAVGVYIIFICIALTSRHVEPCLAVLIAR